MTSTRSIVHNIILLLLLLVALLKQGSSDRPSANNSGTDPRRSRKGSGRIKPFCFLTRRFASTKKGRRIIFKSKMTTESTTTTTTQANVNNDWNAMAGEWDDMGGPKQYRDCFIAKLQEENIIEDGKALTVVDFGCGTGLLIEALRNKLSPESKFIMIDPAKAMADVVQDKILAGEWSNNTRVHCIALANLDSDSDSKYSDIKSDLDSMKGQVDIILASSVMSFIPKQDLEGTMKVLGGLLKSSGGMFIHSDWPQSEDNKDGGFTIETAKSMYKLGGLECNKTEVTKFEMGDTEEGSVFFGIAVKK